MGQPLVIENTSASLVLYYSKFLVKVSRYLFLSVACFAVTIGKLYKTSRDL